MRKEEIEEESDNDMGTPRVERTTSYETGEEKPYRMTDIKL